MPQEERKISVFEVMSGTGRKVKRWEKAEIITRDQLFAILDFEKDVQAKRMMRSLMALALFAIGLGVLSIVGANWLYIPGAAKIGLHFLLNVIVACVVYRSAARGNSLWREGAVMLFFALNLTLIVLIGQVYQLSGNYAAALSLWMVISSPALFMYGRSMANAVFWCVAFLGAFYAVLGDLALRGNDLFAFLLFLAAGLFVPLSFMAAGLDKKLAEKRPAWSVTAFRTGTIFLVFSATMVSFGWYVDISRELTYILETAGSFAEGYVYMLLVCLAAPAAVLGYALLKTPEGGAGIIKAPAALFVLGSLVSMILPLVLMVPEVEFMAAVHFVVYWIFLGWIGRKMGYEQLVSQAITLITLRLIVVYFELFGGLMMTGFGLIFSGVFMLFMLKAANNLKKKIGGKA